MIGKPKPSAPCGRSVGDGVERSNERPGYPFVESRGNTLELIFLFSILFAGGFLAAAMVAGFLAWRCGQAHPERRAFIVLQWISCVVLILFFVGSVQFAGVVFDAMTPMG